MKSEMEKMRSGVLANVTDAEVLKSLENAQKLLLKFNVMVMHEPGYRNVLEALIPGIPASSGIKPPFYCDHGHGIRMGEDVFVNANCTFLDGGYITIGAHTLIGPQVQIYTPHHPIDFTERRKPCEYARPVNIGEDCWIGGGAIICPGVTIGARSIVAAGSVVVRDVPPDSLVAGNPAVVKRKLNE